MTDWKIRKVGKVHEVLEAREQVVFVAGDGVPEFEAIPLFSVPDKGRILTALSGWWHERLAGIAPQAFITCDTRGLDDFFQMRMLEGRCTLMRKLNMVPIRATVCETATGAEFVPRMETGERKVDLTLVRAAEQVARAGFGGAHEIMREMAQYSLRLFEEARAHCERRGLTLTEAEFQFGMSIGGTLMLGGELLTPDMASFGVVDWDEVYPEKWGSSEELAERLRDWYLLIFRMITGRVFNEA